MMNRLELKSNLHTSDTDNHLYLVGTILIDGEAVVDFCSYATSLTELKQSTVTSGTYFILTCWCGVPECVGIHEGVQVIHTQTTIEWVMTQPKPKRQFIFDSKGYKDAVTFGIEQIKQDVAHLGFTPLGEKDEKLIIVPGLDEDMALLEPKARTQMNHRDQGV